VTRDIECELRASALLPVTGWERRKNDLRGGPTIDDLEGVGILIPPLKTDARGIAPLFHPQLLTISRESMAGSCNVCRGRVAQEARRSPINPG
jgi:hypothetical protein